MSYYYYYYLQRNILLLGIPEYDMPPFESVLGDYDIPSTHHLLVQILEAKDLKPFVTGKPEDIFCKVQIKMKNFSGYV